MGVAANDGSSVGLMRFDQSVADLFAESMLEHVLPVVTPVFAEAKRFCRRNLSQCLGSVEVAEIPTETCLRSSGVARGEIHIRELVLFVPPSEDQLPIGLLTCELR